MPRDSSGNYTLPQAPFTPSTTISSTAVNADFSDIATALTQSVATTGVSTISGQLQGTTLAGTPTYSFASDLTTGFGSSAAGVTYILAAGTQTVVVNATGITITGTLSTTAGITCSTVISAADGTVALPSYSFTNDLDTGIYRIGANNIGISVNATKILDIGTGGLTITGTLSVTGGFVSLIVTSGGIVVTGNSSITGNLGVSGILTGGTAGGGMMATQAQMETSTATNVVVSPGVQQYHPLMAKAWGLGNTSGFTGVGVGISSMTRLGVGQYTVGLAFSFSSASYGILITPSSAGGSSGAMSFKVVDTTRSVSAFNLQFYDSGGVLADPVDFTVLCFGDLP